LRSRYDAYVKAIIDMALPEHCPLGPPPQEVDDNHKN
jgi:hypothetical protein